MNLMKGVVQRGTARYALDARPTRRRQDRHVARTTATSGSTASRPISCAGVWIGRDDSTPIGDKITGGGVAVPIWVDFMQKAHPRTPVRDFPVPPNVSFARVEPWSGDPAGPSRGGRVDAVRARHTSGEVLVSRGGALVRRPRPGAVTPCSRQVRVPVMPLTRAVE